VKDFAILTHFGEVSCWYSFAYAHISVPWSAERSVVIRRSDNPVTDLAIFRMIHSLPSLPHSSILLQLLRHDRISANPPLYFQNFATQNLRKTIFLLSEVAHTHLKHS